MKRIMEYRQLVSREEDEDEKRTGFQVFLLL